MTSKELITQLYVGYFNRAPDPVGLEFWIGVLDGGLSLESIAQDFATQPESTATYPFLANATDVDAFIDAIYENLFDRTPDEAGRTFWSGVLNDGFPVGSFILAIIEGASPADEAILANKVEVACDWVEHADDDPNFQLDTAYITASSTALDAVSGDPATVDVGKAAADAFFQEAPSLSLANVISSVPEDTDARVKIADIVITDDGVGTNTLSLSGADAALFEIDGTELYLRAGSALDFETDPSLNVTVEVDDAAVGSSPDDSAALTLAVTDVNEAPSVALANVLASIDESADTSARIKIADIVVTDDALGPETLSLTGADANLFEIDGSELFLRAGSVLNFESNASLDAVVNVNDATVGGVIDDSAAFSVAVADANEAPSVAIGNAFSILSEGLDTSARVRVADVIVTDDGQGTNDLSVSGADAALFEVDATGLYLRAGAALDFETNPVLDVTVLVDDAGVGGSPDDSDSLSINITDVNEGPTLGLSNQLTALDEGTDLPENLKVADIILTDDGAGSNTLALVGSDASLFAIQDGDLFLKAGTVLDFETNPVLDVTVTVNDGTIPGSPDDSVALAINVTDVNEAPTVVITPAVTTLGETDDTSSRIKVADFAVTDDGLGTLELGLSGADAALFEIDGTEIFLASGTALDFEANPQLDVTLEVNDTELVGTPDASASLTIAITDTNEAPSVAVTGAPASLAEDTNITTRLKIADVAVTDDMTGVNSVSLGGSDAALFELDGGELFLKAGTALDFETNPNLDVTVFVDDATLGAGPEDSVDISIAVTDVNEAPALTLNNVVSSLSEDANTAFPIQIASISVSDDGLGSANLGLTGADVGLFEINGLSLDLRPGTALDFETDPSLDVTVTIDDPSLGAGVEDSVSVTLAITDANEAPSISVTPSLTSILEGADTSSAIQVASFQVSDDALGTNTLSLSGGDAGLFEIVGNAVFLKAGTVLDSDANSLLDVVVNVDDATIAGSPDDAEGVVINVLPGAPGAASDTTEQLTFVGNASSSVRFGQVEVADADPGTPGNQPGFVLNTDNADVPYAGVAGNTLSLIDTTGLEGLASFGVIAEVDGQDFTLDNSGSAGDVEACLGEANDLGVLRTPTLAATGEWTFDNSGATGDMEISIKALDASAGGTLNFLNVDICIDDDVDLSAASLNIDGTITLKVAAGVKLTLTVEQVDDLETAGVVITGEGTVCVVGESDSSVAALNTTFGAVIQTAGMDLSQVTLDAGDSTLEITVNGALSAPGGDEITQTVIGSANNDAVTITSSADDNDFSTMDVILRLGEDSGDIGDPKNTDAGAGAGQDAAEMTGDTIDSDDDVNIQIEVDAGFDALLSGLSSPGAVADVVQVAAGTAFYAAEIASDWVADANSINNGTAVIEADGSSNETVDVSAVGGANGWTLLGAADDGTGDETTLIGSDQDDMIIDSTGNGSDNSDQEDMFTGGAGEDMFVFNVATTTPATFATTEIQAASDVEYINIDLGGVDAASALLTIEYQLNNVTTVAVVSDGTAPGGPFDFSVNAELAAAVAAVMDDIAGISAEVDAVTNTQVNLVGENGNLLNINSISANASGGGGMIDLVAEAAADDDADNSDDTADAGDDDLQITDSTLSGTVTPGETYLLTVALRDGSEIQAEYTAQVADTLADVVLGLIANGDNTGINDLAAGAVVASVSPADGTGATIRITDGDDDDGGFELTVSEGQSILSASSVSSILPGAGGGGEVLADQDADIITDFDDDDDLLTFGLAAGSGTNYDEAANEATFADALAAAHTAFAADADLVYYLTGSNDVGDGGPVGLLFVNANGNDEADTVVALQGVSASNFDDSNIV